MGKVAGFDLGTTNTVVAIVDGPQPSVLPTSEGKQQSRSAVSLRKNGERLVGNTAIDNWPANPENTIVSIKRLMGRASNDREVENTRREVYYRIEDPEGGTKDGVCVRFGDKQFTPPEISAMILQKAKADAEYTLSGETVTHGVITVPAYFTDTQRAATRLAAQLAGLKVIRLIDEPTAAAIAFGLNASQNADPQWVLVYDLGGGTFDVSLLVMTSGTFSVVAKTGDMWLGGDNFDQILVDYAVEHVKKEFGVDPTKKKRAMASLKKAAQEAKEALSQQNSASIIVAGLLQNKDGDPIDLDLDITQEQFVRMILPLIDEFRTCENCQRANRLSDDRCFWCRGPLSSIQVGKALRIVRQTLSDAHLTQPEVNHVLMAGNSSLIPLVQQSMEKEFGLNKIRRSIHPKHCVAMGAAVLAAMLGPLLQCNACEHINEKEVPTCEKCGASMSFAEDDSKGSDDEPRTGFIVITGTAHNYGIKSASGKFHVFIKKGDPIPTDNPETQTFKTQSAGQRIIAIPVFVCEDLNSDREEKQGDVFVLLPPNLPSGSKIHIKLWLDDSEVFQLTAKLDNGDNLRPAILRGGTDSGAVSTMMDAEALLIQNTDRIPPDARFLIDNQREKVFSVLQSGDYDLARAEADKFMREAAKHLPGDPELEFYRFLNNHQRSEYNWMLLPSELSRSQELEAEVGDAVERHDQQTLEEAKDRLEKFVNNMPFAVTRHTHSDLDIMFRIRPEFPTDAAQLLAWRERIHEQSKILPSELWRCKTAEEFVAKAERLSVLMQQILIDTIEYFDKVEQKAGECGGVGGGKQQAMVCPVPDCGSPMRRDKPSLCEEKGHNILEPGQM